MQKSPTSTRVGPGRFVGQSPLTEPPAPPALLPAAPAPPPPSFPATPPFPAVPPPAPPAPVPPVPLPPVPPAQSHAPQFPSLPHVCPPLQAPGPTQVRVSPGEQVVLPPRSLLLEPQAADSSVAAATRANVVARRLSFMGIPGAALRAAHRCADGKRPARAHFAASDSATGRRPGGVRPELDFCPRRVGTRRGSGAWCARMTRWAAARRVFHLGQAQVSA